MSRIRRALVMAAGRGLRMKPLTDVIPKPMAPIGGSTLIAKGIERLRTHLSEVHITVGYKGAMLAGHVIEHNVSSVINTEGKGNSWWIYHSLLSACDEPVLVLTCDNVVELDFALLEEDYAALADPPCMVVPVRPVAGLDGDYIFQENNRVTRLSRTDVSDVYCSGMQVLNPAAIVRGTRPTESFYEVWEQLIATGQLACSSVYPQTWLAIDTLQQLSAASARFPQ